MFRRQHHKGCPINRIHASGKHFDLLIGMPFYLKPHRSTLRAPDPVGLLILDRFGPVNRFQTFQQAICISGNTHSPLFHQLTLHRITAALAHTVFHFVVRQHCTQRRAPVDIRFFRESQAIFQQHQLLLFFAHGVPFRSGKFRRILVTNCIYFGVALIGKTYYQITDRSSFVKIIIIIMIEQLHKNPLRPFVKFRIGSAHFAAPVIAEAQIFQLPAEGINIIFGGNRRMLAGTDRVLLGWQAKRVIAHRVQHVKAFQAFVPRENISGDVAQRVPYVQARARRIREHVQHIIFGLIAFIIDFINMMVVPKLFPLFLNITGIVFHSIPDAF